MGHAKNIAERTEKNPDKFAKLGEVADAKYSEITLLKPPSLLALKLQDVLMKQAGGRICDDQWHQVEMATFKHITGMRNLDRKDLVLLLREIRHAVLQSENMRDGYTSIFGLISVANIDYENGGKIRYQFDPTFRKIADESDLYAVLDHRTSLALTSKYAHRLYDMITLRAGRNKNTEKFLIDDLRAHLGVQTGKLTTWNSLRVKALDRAISEINQVSLYNVSYEISKKTNRKVTEIELKWTSRKDISEAKKEQAAHSVARKGRLAEAGENLTFPGSGSIRHTPWGTICRANCKWDVDKVAGEFREWLDGLGIQRDAPGMVSRFTTFCEGKGKKSP